MTRMDTDVTLFDHDGFHRAAAGRWVMPLDTLICTFDAALLRLVGLSEDQRSIHIFDYFKNVHPDDAPKLRQLTQHVRDTGSSFDVTFRLTRPDTGETMWINSRGHVDRGDNGQAVVFGTNYDVTAFKRREETSRLVAGEMSHRIKNILTVVQSLFRMSAIRAVSVDELKDSFSARLMALKALNDILLQPDAQLTTDNLVDGVIGPIKSDNRITLAVAMLPLQEEAAQTVCLCLNELMTNAIKHGALSQPNGRVTIEISRDENANQFVLSWCEEGCSLPDEQPLSSGFGFTLLQDMTRMSFDGQPEITWRPAGVHFHCRWPADKVCG